MAIAPEDTSTTDLTSALLSRRAVNLEPAIAMSGTPGVISFTYGLPDEDFFPSKELAAATALVMAEQSASALQYNSPRPLAEYLVNFIKREEGLELTPANLLITAGSSQALSLVCRLLIDPGDYVVVEAPSFMGAMKTFLNAEAKLVEVAMDDEGLNIEALDQKLTELKAAGHKVKFIYTIPTFHNPMGVTMGLERRQALLEVAHRHAVMILEDDAYHGLLFEGEVPPWLWTLDRHDVVVHCGTFSKTLAAGMRLGWVGGSPELIAKMAALKDDGGTNPFAGYIAAKFAENGQLDQHIKKLIDIYRKKRDRTLAALERYMPAGTRWTMPQGGFFIWVELPESLDTVKLLPSAIEAGVNYLPGPACYASRSGRHCIRVAFSHIKLDQIEPGMRILGQVIEREMAG